MTSISNETNVFQRNSKITITIIVLVLVPLLIGLTEIVLREVMGLGNPVIYNNYPLYGYRPLPSREYSRFLGAKIRINNLSLRADADWDGNREDKILFLGDSVTWGGSRMNNTDLFSYLATHKLGDDYLSGNAGVNAWGVENIYGLVVDTEFQPAATYVTVVPERDFYRGLVRFQGMPYYNKSPRYALGELWYLLVHLQDNARYLRWKPMASEAETELVVDKAVSKLKEMDRILKKKGYRHFVFISPTSFQVLNGAVKDPLLQKVLQRQGLSPTYILDDILEIGLPDEQKQVLFHDPVHLNRPGHKLWADIIAAELQQHQQ